MFGTLGTIQRKCGANELVGQARAILNSDMVRALEELVEVGIIGELDIPAIGRIRNGWIGVVDREVHRDSGE